MKKYLMFAAILFLFPVLVSAKPMTFAVLSDIHYAVDAPDKAMKLLATGKKLTPSILKEISNNKDIEFVVFSGDLLVDPYYKDLNEFKKVLDENLTKPYYVVYGNHDRPMDKQKDEVGKTVFRQKDFEKTFNTKRFWSKDVDGYHLIGLDSSRPDTWGGTISKDEVEWLKKDLQKNSDKFTIIFAHHNFVEFYPERNLRMEFLADNYKEIQDLLFNNPQVKFVVGGHYHFPAEIFKDGIHYFSMPSTMTYPCAYSIFTVDKDNVDFKVISVGDEAYREKAMKGLPEQKDWRERFALDEQIINMFRGLKSYTFEPRM